MIGSLNFLNSCKSKELGCGSYKFDDLLFKDFSRIFQGLFTMFKESVSTGTIITFLPSHSKKAEFPFPHDTKPNEDNITGCSPPILLLFLCLSLFMCNFNADSPKFEMLIIRSQHLQKAFFLSALNAVNQPGVWKTRIANIPE